VSVGAVVPIHSSAANPKFAHAKLRVGRVLARGANTFWRSRSAILSALASGLVLASFAGRGYAEPAARAPQYDPNQAQKNLEAIQLERRRARNGSVPLPTVPKPEISGDTKPLFKLAGVAVEGAAALPAGAIAATYRPYIGKMVSQADLSTIASKISDLYREAGFHLSRAIVPPQNIESGRIRIQVIEGAIADIVLKGAGAEQFGIRELLSPLLVECPARLATLERQLLLANDRPGVHITDTAIEEIGTASGRFRLVVDLETWHVFQSYGLDNWGTPAVGPLELYSTSALNSFLLPGDTLGLNLSNTPDKPHELGFSRLFYDAPVGTGGARLGATAAYGEIWPGDERSLIGINTRTEALQLHGSVVPIETRRSSLVLSATADYANVSETSSLGQIYDDHLRSVRAAADVQHQDDFGGQNYITVGIREGFNVLGATHQGDAFASTYNGTSLAAIADFALTRYQKLSDPWSIKVAIAGQLASTSLLESQEFYLGGPLFGRGYYSGEVSGDNGIAGAVELRFDHALGYDWLKGFQAYGFFDHGSVWNVGDWGDHTSLTSIGAGVRLHFPAEFEGDVGFAVPLDYRAPDNPGRDPHYYFSLTKSFRLCPERMRLLCSS
jgi:hemolysin activation/secretion protein